MLGNTQYLISKQDISKKTFHPEGLLTLYKYKIWQCNTQVIQGNAQVLQGNTRNTQVIQGNVMQYNTKQN